MKPRAHLATGGQAMAQEGVPKEVVAIRTTTTP